MIFLVHGEASQFVVGGVTVGMMRGATVVKTAIELISHMIKTVKSVRKDAFGATPYGYFSSVSSMLNVRASLALFVTQPF